MQPTEEFYVPNMFNLRMDPKETHNIAGDKGGGFTFLTPVMNTVLQPYMRSFEEYPNADYSKFKN